MPDQPTLFGPAPTPSPTVLGSAVLSDCERYRYLLGREWGDGPTAVFVMLNPSTADALRDDPTIRRCLGYARHWGCGALMVANLYAWRATDPDDLWTVDDPVGPENDAHLYAAATVASESGGPLVGAWGANAKPDRIAAVLALPGMDRLTALDVTKAGQPKHPLYLKAELTPQPWMAPAA
ncbi:DUF1643 domain-containing protein [Streptomyces sp. NPDC056670]|uniref:DUF1643 domain-containing protein n=1 Tax=Streptomyces sp. NPDC056670 TaxID=3345904 RepID=UPI00369E52AA